MPSNICFPVVEVIVPVVAFAMLKCREIGGCGEVGGGRWRQGGGRGEKSGHTGAYTNISSSKNVLFEVLGK